MSIRNSLPKILEIFLTLYLVFLDHWLELNLRSAFSSNHHDHHQNIKDKGFASTENARSRHQRLFEENVRKTETCGLRTLIVKGSRVVFTHGEGISTPRVHHKKWQPSIKCANMTSKLRIFPFFMFFCFLWAFLYFLSFCGRQGCFPRSIVSSIVMRKSDLSCSCRTKHWLICFDLFSQDRF